MPDTIKLTLREADVMVAEKVMGWKRVGVFADIGVPDLADWTSDGKRNIADENWSPTTDPAASKMLREAILDRYKFYDITARKSAALDEPYVCTIMDGRSAKFVQWIAAAATEEFAVVLCALKSVGIEVEIA